MKTISFDETKFRLVPVEPTEEMLAAAQAGDREYTLRNFGDVMTVMQGPYDHWCAMLAAAPEAPASVTLTEAERSILNRVSLFDAAPEAPKPEADGYGSTDVPYAFAGIELTEGDKRLFTMLVNAFGNRHPAVDDLVALLFSRRNAAPHTAQADEAAKWRELFWSVARALGCLPSTSPDANAHVYLKAERLAAQADKRMPRDVAGYVKPAASVLEREAVRLLNAVKAWRDSEGNEPFPSDLVMWIDALLMMAEQRRTNLTEGPAT
jgi:hypothetical protein